MNLRLASTLAATCLALSAALAPTQAALVVNGGFEAGVSGFTSAYTLRLPDLYPAGVYNVGPDAHNFHAAFFGLPHSGSLFMIVNGADVANTIVWEEAGIAVAPATTYYFSAWVSSVNPTSPAQLNFSINGSSIGAVFSPSNVDGVWSQFYVPWNSGLATTADISIVNQNTNASGNDFGLDDISLSTFVPVPEPVSLTLLGAGLAGLGLIRRRA